MVNLQVLVTVLTEAVQQLLNLMFHLSLPGGTIQHPGPEDQYSVDVSTKIYTNGGIGNDWGVFEVFPNSITGLMPKEAQGAFWPLVQDLGPDSIRITGYGVDDGDCITKHNRHILDLMQDPVVPQ